MYLTKLGCVFAVLFSLAASAQSQPELRLGPNGLGTSALGMTARQVEGAIGHALVIEPRKRKNWGAAECTVTAEGLPGTRFVFDHGRLMAVILAPPSRLKTREGIGVGDSERLAIQSLRALPTYDRHPNQYDDGKGTSMEITVGRPIVDPRTQQLKGTMMKINSSKGKIVSIEAGLARYVVMVEHEGDDCEPVR